MKNKITLLGMLLVFVLGGAGQAFAVINSFDQFRDGGTESNVFSSYVEDYTATSDITGTWTVRALFSEAGNTNLYLEGDDTSLSTLFNSKHINLDTTFEDVDLSETSFQDQSVSDTRYDITSKRVFAYMVTSEFYYKDILLSVGDLLLGFEDPGGNDDDYDDFVVQASPTPLPNAIWMLGTGLVALVGIRRYAW